jgi:hypothetical protein
MFTSIFLVNPSLAFRTRLGLLCDKRKRSRKVQDKRRGSVFLTSLTIMPGAIVKKARLGLTRDTSHDLAERIVVDLSAVAAWSFAPSEF